MHQDAINILEFVEKYFGPEMRRAARIEEVRQQIGSRVPDASTDDAARGREAVIKEAAIDGLDAKTARLKQQIGDRLLAIYQTAVIAREVEAEIAAEKAAHGQP